MSDLQTLKALRQNLDEWKQELGEYQRGVSQTAIPRLRELYAKPERLCDAKARENNKRFELKQQKK